MEEAIRIAGRDSRKNYRYAVYEHKLVTVDGLSYIRSFIVLKNQYGVIVRFTRLHNYTGAYNNRTARPLASDANARMHYICMMLNYILIDNYGTYRIDHVFKVTKEMLVAFFTDYAMGTKVDGGHRGSESVENCIHSVTLFFAKLIWKYGGYVTMKRDELYRETQGYDHRGRLVKKSVPDFEIRYVPEEKEIFRDIPTKVFKILMNLALRYAPDIAFAMGLQAFAGLRPGEVMNVRQEGSPKGSGIIFTYLDGRLTRVPEGWCGSPKRLIEEVDDCIQAVNALGEIGDCKSCRYFRRDRQGRHLDFFDTAQGRQKVEADSWFLMHMVEAVRQGIGCKENIRQAMLTLQQSCHHYRECLWKDMEAGNGKAEENRK